MNWQGYPYFEASCLDGRPERGRYRVFFTPDRLVFLPVLDRPTSRLVDPIKYGLVGLLIGLAFLFVPIPREFRTAAGRGLGHRSRSMVLAVPRGRDRILHQVT